MSLQYAAALMNQRDKQEPLERGLSAGQAAYRNAGQSSLGQSVSQGLSQAAAQRQVLTDNAAKQAAGQYGNTGTSAAAYEYLHGQGKYPVNPVPGYIPLPGTTLYKGLPPTAAGVTPAARVPAGTAGAPVQKPYEQANNVGNPTQADLANAAKTSPTRMGARPTPPGVAKPSTMSQLLGTLGPAYLGYTLLDKSIAGGLGGGISSLYNNLMYPTGVYGAEGAFFGTSPAAYFSSSGPAQAAAWDAATAGDYGGPTAAASTAEAATIQSQLDAMPPVEVGPPVQVADASGALPDSLTAPVATENAYTAAQDATDAAAVASGAPTTAVSDVNYVNGADLASDTATAAATSEADVAAAQTAAEAGGIDWAAMSAEYGPYVAAAYVLSQNPVVQNFVSKVEDKADQIIGGAGDIGQDVWDTITGGCFLTTAAVDHAGEKDDGDTLTAMRDLRDAYLRKFPEGRKEVEWYYRKAPKIVAAIDKKPNAHAIYMRMYNDHIKPTAKAVEQGNYEKAHQLYNKLIGFSKKVSGLSTKELEAKTKQGIPKDIKKHFAEGGATGLPQVSHLGSYSGGGRLLKGPGDGVPDMRPELAPTNTLGQLLDSDLSTAYQRAVDTGAESRARTLKKELDYRARMKAYQNPPQQLAHGGLSDLGSYSDGGRLLRGPGDGVSDSIPAVIGKRQPARLADGEFVVPARIVSELGNGSTEAGARKLYAMMDRIQAGRKKSIGKGKVAVNSRADKNLPA